MEAPLRSRIQWSKKKYTLLEFSNSFSSLLPLMVKVEDGYCGQNEVETLERELIIRVQKVVCQPRVVALDSRKNHISIPIRCTQKFKIASKSSKDQASGYCMADILEKQGLPVKVQFASSDYIKTTKASAFGEMTLKHVFDEKFIEGHIISDTGSLYNTVLVLPLYVRITLVVAEGLIAGTAEQWIKELDKHRDVMAHSYLDCQEILLYDPKDIREGNEYDFVQPTDFVPIPRAAERGINKSTRVAAPNIYHPNPQAGSGACDVYQELDMDPHKSIAKQDKGSKADKMKKLGKTVVLRRPTQERMERKVKPRTLKRSKLALPAIPGGSDETKNAPTPATPTSSEQTCHTQTTVQTPPADNLYEPLIKTLSKGSPDKPIALYESVVQAMKGKQELKPVPPNTKSFSNTRDPYVKKNEDKSHNSQRQNHGHVPPLAAGNHGTPNSRRHFNSFADVPSDISNCSMTEVTDCLALLKLDKYVTDFRNEMVDGAILCYMDEMALQEQFDMTMFEARKLLMFAQRGWRPNTATASSDI